MRIAPRDDASLALRRRSARLFVRESVNEFPIGSADRHHRETIASTEYCEIR
jgi:hypothetical protein